MQERLHEPLGMLTAEEEYEEPADMEKLYAWFERLDAGCTLDQVLQAAEQIAEGDCTVELWPTFAGRRAKAHPTREPAAGGRQSRLGRPPRIAANLLS